MRAFGLILGFSCFAWGLTTQSLAEDAKTEEGFKLLFNGKDLTGWKIAATKDKDKSGESVDGKTETPTKRFTVQEGAIVIDPKVKGDMTLYTAKTFGGDTVIRFDFKAGPGCNNDLYFRGMKFDINKKGDPKNLKEGEWNTFEIIVKGEAAEFLCNGEKVKSVKAKSGATTFGIRAEFGPIEIRKLRIKSAE